MNLINLISVLAYLLTGLRAQRPIVKPVEKHKNNTNALNIKHKYNKKL